MASIKEQAQLYEKQQVERDRRNDIECERDFWINVVLGHLTENPSSLEKAVEQADEALRLYRERFQ